MAYFFPRLKQQEAREGGLQPSLDDVHVWNYFGTGRVVAPYQQEKGLYPGNIVKGENENENADFVFLLCHLCVNARACSRVTHTRTHTH